MDMSKYKGMFIEESREHLKSINKLLLSLEKKQDDQSTINTLFREFHSIKGMAASMGYEPVMGVSHSIEDLLDVVRKQQIITPDEVMSLLFRSTDVLETMINEISDDKEFSDSGEELMSLIRKSEGELKIQDQSELDDGPVLDAEVVDEQLDVDHVVEETVKSIFDKAGKNTEKKK